MHPQLEKYLAEIKANLKGLTPTERDLEIQEINDHLNSLFAQHQAAGLSEDEAAQTTMQQFGTPQAIGREVVNATPGRQSSVIKSMLWGAVVGVILVGLSDLLFRGALKMYLTGPTPLYWRFYFPWLGHAAICGAIASLFARRFDSPNFDRALGQGLIRGAVGGFLLHSSYTQLFFPLMMFSMYPNWMLYNGNIILTALFYTLGSALIIGFGTLALANWRKSMRRKALRAQRV